MEILNIHSGYKKLNRKNIKYSRFTVSLIEEAGKAGIFSADDLERIQVEMAEVLSECINIYTHGESTSIMTETANSLVMSVLFAIDAYLISLGDMNEAIKMIQTDTFKNLYYKGMRQLKLLICEITSLLVKVKRTKIIIPNVIYNDVIDFRIMKYLKSYNIATGAHIDGKFSYPLAVPCSKLKGIYYLKRYLMNLYAENLFCRGYDTLEINKLYKTLCYLHSLPYDKAEINIYKPVFLNALFAGYLMKEHGSLHITHEDCEKIQKLFTGLSNNEQTEILKSASARLGTGNPDYNEKILNAEIPQILNSIKHKTLKNYIVTTK
ncbi:MAG: DUF6179 domain-containing protein [Oscillospiraceae bacterium]|nr:DUF6179 domain-containing protein [Oscillospiraceae bacterium]